MPSIKASDMLGDIYGFRDKIFTPDSLHRAEMAYRKLVDEKIANDMHNTSTTEIVRVIDHLLALQTYEEIKHFLENENPNLVAFLFVRIQHFVHYLESLGDEPVQFSFPSRSVVRWGVVDFWDTSLPSDEPY